jgi:hypothetical protein
VLDKPFKGVCKHLSLGKNVTPKAMRRTFQDRSTGSGRRSRPAQHLRPLHGGDDRALRLGGAGGGGGGAREGGIAGGYRDLLAGTSKAPRNGGKAPSGGQRWETRSVSRVGREWGSYNRARLLSFFERDIGFEPTTFSLGRAVPEGAKDDGASQGRTNLHKPSASGIQGTPAASRRG